MPPLYKVGANTTSEIDSVAAQTYSQNAMQSSLVILKCKHGSRCKSLCVTTCNIKVHTLAHKMQNYFETFKVLNLIGCHSKYYNMEPKMSNDSILVAIRE